MSEAETAARIERLVAQFNGAIKYTPMIKDHPDWTDEECIAFARKHDALARARYLAGDTKWNNGVPYCRNLWKG